MKQTNKEKQNMKKSKIIKMVGVATVVAGASSSIAPILTSCSNNKQDAISPVTLERAISYKNDMLNQFAAKTFAYARNVYGFNEQAAKTKAVNQAVIMNTKLAPAFDKLKGLSTKAVNNDTELAYQAVHTEAKKLGLDIVDFDNFKNSTLPETTKSLIKAYKEEAQVEPEQAEQSAGQFKITMEQEIIPKAKQQL
jgi:hypothetical protein